MNKMYRVNGSKFLIEKLPDGTCIIWDEKLEEALAEWVQQGKPQATPPPLPIVASNLSEEEAFDWLTEELELGGTSPSVTRVQ